MGNEKCKGKEDGMRVSGREMGPEGGRGVCKGEEGIAGIVKADDPDELNSNGGGKHEEKGDEDCAEKGMCFVRLGYDLSLGAHGEALILGKEGERGCEGEGGSTNGDDYVRCAGGNKMDRPQGQQRYSTYRMSYSNQRVCQIVMM